MSKITITTEFDVFNSIEELSTPIQNLMQQAITIRKSAYAPYSNFKVGTSILLENGKILVGSNQENAAYPSGLCAERVAIYQAGSLYPKTKIIAMAISASSEHNTINVPIPPCGSCRQSIAEYEIKQNYPIEIYFMGEIGSIYKSDSLKNLLPLLFDKKFL